MRNRGCLRSDSIGPRYELVTRNFRWFRVGLGHERGALAQTNRGLEPLERMPLKRSRPLDLMSSYEPPSLRLLPDDSKALVDENALHA
jgi:hypothetical protein